MGLRPSWGITYIGLHRFVLPMKLVKVCGKPVSPDSTLISASTVSVVSYHLADAGIASQDIGVLHDG